MTAARLALLLALFPIGTLFSQDADSQEPTARVTGWLRADEDGDGKLAKAETEGLMERYFDRNDKDRDGFLDGAELAALDAELTAREKARQDRAPRPKPAQELPDGVAAEKDLRYREGHERWVLDLYLPEEEAPEGGRPGIVFVHGGGWKNGSKDNGQWSRLPAQYAGKGYVCISLNYRLTGDGGGFPNCVEDVKTAVRWFRANAEEYGLDPDRLGAYGNSAGAHLVSMLGLVGPDAELEGDGPHPDRSSLVQAVCASATPADFPNWGAPLDRFGLLKVGDSEAPVEERAVAASPITYVGEDAPPFLLIHARDDRVVPFAQGKGFADALEEAGAEVTLMDYDGGGHGVFGQKSAETGPAMEAFFAEHLGL